MKTVSTIETILTRKSVRNYTPTTISKEQIDLLLKSGMAAPSARNKRPWHFIVVEKRETLDVLADQLPYTKMLFQTPLAIVVCGDTTIHEPSGSDFWIMDCSAATQNILLAAEALGLGAIWTAVYPREDRIKVVKKELQLPETIMPLCVIPIGKADGQDRPMDKYDPTKIHKECW